MRIRGAGPSDGPATRRASGRYLGSALLSVVDQSVCSASTFATAIIAGKALSPAGYGEFALLMTGITALLGLSNSLVTGPLRVLGVGEPLGAGSTQLGHQASIQLVLAAVLLIGSLGVLSPGFSARPELLSGYLLALGSVHLFEFVRAVLATRMRFARLLALDLLTHSVRVGSLGALYFVGLEGAGSLFGVIAGANALGVVLFLIALPYGGVRLAPLRRTWRKNWDYGRWLLAETGASFLSTQVYLFATAWHLDTGAAAGLAAAQTIANAMNIVLMGAGNAITPAARDRLVTRGVQAWRSWLLLAGQGMTAVVLLGSLPLVFWSRDILGFVYTPHYEQFGFLVPVLCLAIVLGGINSILLITFRTAEYPQAGLWAKLAAATITVLLGIPLLRTFGLLGAAIGLVVTQLTWLTAYLVQLPRGMAEARKIASRHLDESEPTDP